MSGPSAAPRSALLSGFPHRSVEGVAEDGLEEGPRYEPPCDMIFFEVVLRASELAVCVDAEVLRQRTGMRGVRVSVREMPDPSMDRILHHRVREALVVPHSLGCRVRNAHEVHDEGFTQCGGSKSHIRDIACQGRVIAIRARREYEDQLDLPGTHALKQ